MTERDSSAPVASAPAPARDTRVEHATRHCVKCGGHVGESLLCARCGSSEVVLCEHVAARPSWRMVRHLPVGESDMKREVVALTVGDVSVFLGRYRDALLLRSEEGLRLPFQRVRGIEPGSEIIERLTNLGTCYRCSVAFFLPDCEVAAKGVPRILRVPLDRPTRHYISPGPDPRVAVEAYKKLPKRRQG